MSTIGHEHETIRVGTLKTALQEFLDRFGGSGSLNKLLTSMNDSLLDPTLSQYTNKVLVNDRGSWSFQDYNTGGGGGEGTVESVGLSMPSGFSVSNSPIRSSGEISVSFGGSLTKNMVLATPSDRNGAPSWRSLVAADIDFSDYTWWGQTLQDSGQTKVVTGPMTGVTSIDTLLYFDTTNNRIGIGRQNPQLKLDVDGDARVSKLYLYKDSSDSTKDVYLEYVQGQSGVHLAGAGLYADSYISALGTGSSGGGGAALDNLLMSLNSAANVQNTGVSNQVLVCSNGSWAWRPYSSEGGGGGIGNVSLWGNAFDGTQDLNGDITIDHNGTTASRFIAVNDRGQVELMAAENNRGIYDRDGSAWIIGTGPAATNPNTFLMRGNVGIGTTTPSYKLHVVGTSGTDVARLTASGNADPLVLDATRGYTVTRYMMGNAFKWSVGCDEDKFYWYSGGTSSIVLSILNNGNVGVGTTSPAVKLDVSGDLRVTQKIYFHKDASNSANDVYLEYVSSGSGKGVHLVGDGFYSDSFVSALGTGSSGGPVVLNDLLTSLNASSIVPGSQTNQVLVYNGTNGWSFQAYGGGGGGGTGSVTRVDGEAANGSHLTLTGGPITTTGTLTVGVATGYSIPLTADQTNWETAYTWVNTIDPLLKVITGSSQIKVGSNTTPATYTNGTNAQTGNPNVITPKLYVSGHLGVSENVFAKSIDLYNATPYIDFHYGSSTADYTSRISEGASQRLDINNTIFVNHTSRSEYGGCVGIGWNDPRYTLQVNGNTYTNRLYLAAGVYFEYDNNGGVRLNNAGFYADTFVSALGTGSGSSSSGGGISLNDMWEALAAVAPSQNSQLINNSHINLNHFTIYARDNVYREYDGQTSLSLRIHDYFVTNDTNQTVSGVKTFTGDFFTSSDVDFMDNGNNNDFTCWIPATFNKSVGIGVDANNSYKLYVSGSTLLAGDVYVSNRYVKLYTTQVYNDAYILDISAAGLRLNGNSITSDIRKKDVLSMVNDLTVEKIARAPIFNFKWKQWPDGLTYVGTSAQYWDTVLPNAVLDLDDTLSLDYGATALAAAVMTARTVLSHEERIKKLEAENERLRNEIELLKAA